MVRYKVKTPLGIQEIHFEDGAQERSFVTSIGSEGWQILGIEKERTKKMNDETRQYLNILFDEEDHVCYGTSPYDILVTPQSELPDGVCYVGVNSFRPGTTRKKVNVDKHRSFTLEFDVGRKRSHFNYIWSNDVPYSVAVDSGGKSTHFIITLENPVDASVYDDCTRAIKRIQANIDKTPLHSAGFTRLAGVTRDNGNPQKLLKVKGRIPNEDFMSWLAMYDPGEPERPPWEKEGTRDLKDLPWNTAKVLEEGDWSHFSGRHEALGVLCKDLLRLGFDVEETRVMLTDTAELVGITAERDADGEVDRLLKYWEERGVDKAL